MFRNALALLCVCCVAAGPKVVITEIQYDPKSEESDDQQTEWVEIRNCGSQSASLKGFQITSGSKARPHDAKQRFVLGDLAIAPGEYLVIGVGQKSCYAELELPAMAAYCGETKYAWLTNDGDSVAIRDAQGRVVDEVVYRTEATWPVIKGSGSSIQFIPPAGEDPAEANDTAGSWVASDSTNSEAFGKHGRGTPGSGPKQSATTRPTASAQLHRK